MKDPEDSANFLIRRLAAIEGYEMASKDADDEPFVLEKDQCWVLADNEKLKPKVCTSPCFKLLSWYIFFDMFNMPQGRG